MRNLAIVLFTAAIYAITAHFSQYLAIHGTYVSPIWPPAGIALAAVLIYGNIALLGVFIGCLIADFHVYTGGGYVLFSIINAVVPSLGGTIQAYVGKFALMYFAKTSNIFKSTRSVLTFILISAFAACLINSTLGTTTLILTNNITIQQFPYAWLTWWIADAVGVISVASTILAWHQKESEKMSLLKILELIIMWSLILIVGYIALSLQLMYLLIPFAIWIGFQFDIKFSTLSGLLISSFCLFGATIGHVFIGATSITTSIILVQLFISIIFLTILLIHVILAARRNAFKKLQILNRELEERVLIRTKDLLETNHELEIQKDKAIQAFEALKQSHARLMQTEKMASLGMLTAGVAHEIKNPLNAMSANMSTIKENIESLPQADKQFKEKTTALIAATNEGIKRTAGVIADLCAYARSDEPEMIDTDIHKNIDSTINLLSSEIKGNVKVIKEYGNVPNILCHPGKINQVVMNIIINAIHALQSSRNGKITIKTTYQNESIILSIKDNGPGMKKETVDKLFTPFFTTKQNGMGSGLGLFISSNIIKEHHGSIKVMSEIGKGTEFIITLPIKGE